MPGRTFGPDLAFAEEARGVSANRGCPADALSLTSSKEHRFDVLMFNGMEDPDFKYWIERWSNGRTALVVTTPTVERIYGTLLRRACDGLSPSPIWLVLACSEASKTLESVEAVGKAALDCGIE